MFHSDNQLKNKTTMQTVQTMVQDVQKNNKKMGIIAKIPAGFQNGTANRHNTSTAINGNAAHRKLIIFFFIIYIRFVCQTVIQLRATVFVVA